MGASNVTAGSDHSAPEADVQLMELIVSRENMMAAYARVVGNKGAAGIDKMSVADLKPFLAEHWPRIREDLLADRYQPQAVRGVEIPKPGGGMRQLGIPTAVDRLIQQAMHQVLTPLFDPGFSPHSYGFRAGRRAHDAVKAARAYVAGGRALRRRYGPREVLRPGEPRRADGTRGAQGRRQAGAAAHSPLPAGWIDAGRDRDSSGRRERRKVGRSRRCCRTSCSTTSTRNWNGAATPSAGMRTTATSTLPRSAPESG